MILSSPIYSLTPLLTRDGAGSVFRCARHSGWQFLVLVSMAAGLSFLPGCGGGAVFIGDGVAASVNVPPSGNRDGPVLSLVTPEPAGSRCPRGGSRVDAGVDDNRNGTLETGEVDTTNFVCNN